MTTLAGGILNVASLSNSGSPSSIGNRGADGGSNVGLLFRGGTLQYTGSTPQSTDRQIRISTVGGATIDASGSNPNATVNFTHTGGNTDFYENGGARTLTLTGSNTGTNSFAFTITDQAAGTGLTTVNKTGAGTWVLTGASTYTGPTTLSGGRLLVNGSLANTPVTVQTGATLGGGGAIGGNVSIASGGTISPGNSPGILTITRPGTTSAALTLASGATYVAEIGSGVPAAGVNYDQILVNGTNVAPAGSVQLGGSTLSISLLGTPQSNGQFVIVDNATTAPTLGQFAGLTEGQTFTVGSTLFQITYAGNAGDGTPGNDVILTAAVPEPTSLSLLVLGGMGLLARRRRRARQVLT